MQTEGQKGGMQPGWRDGWGCIKSSSKELHSSQSIAQSRNVPTSQFSSAPSLLATRFFSLPNPAQLSIIQLFQDENELNGAD